MDAIGSSTKLMWFFVFIYSFPILLLILSVTIWSYKKFKRLAFISYIADTILTVLFFILSVIFIIISIGYRCKNKKISNIFINITTLLCTFVCVIQINTINV